MSKVLLVATVQEHICHFHLSLVRDLCKAGHEVHVAARNNIEGRVFDGFQLVSQVFDIPFERFPFHTTNIKAYHALKKVIVQGKYDIIHCNTPVASIFTRLICRKYRKNGLKVIYTAHGFHFFKGGPLSSWLIYYPIEKFCSRFTDILITINQEDYTLAKTKMKAKKVVYIPGVGVDTQKYADVVINREEKCQELGIPVNAKILLSVGELSTSKNHQVVIRALKKLNDSSIHYVIAGAGSEKENLILLSEELGLSEQVHLVGYRRDIGELCKLADVFCFPSRREGLPVALMEAMGSGLPCVVSRIRGNTDLIEDEKGGYLVSADSVEQFHKSIEMLLVDDGQWKKMGQCNQEAVKLFDVGNVDKEMRKIYKNSVIDRKDSLE